MNKVKNKLKTNLVVTFAPSAGSHIASFAFWVLHVAFSTRFGRFMVLSELAKRT